MRRALVARKGLVKELREESTDPTDRRGLSRSQLASSVCSCGLRKELFGRWGGCFRGLSEIGIRLLERHGMRLVGLACGPVGEADRSALVGHEGG